MRLMRWVGGMVGGGWWFSDILVACAARAIYAIACVCVQVQVHVHHVLDAHTHAHTRTRTQAHGHQTYRESHPRRCARCVVVAAHNCPRVGAVVRRRSPAPHVRTMCGGDSEVEGNVVHIRQKAGRAGARRARVYVLLAVFECVCACVRVCGWFWCTSAFICLCECVCECMLCVRVCVCEWLGYDDAFVAFSTVKSS